jgi:phosphatidylserine/phosphatidylglycerophosphate/cardiolipin synthase-like enzyme
MKVYAVTVNSHPWLLPAVEEALKQSNVGAAGDVSNLARNIRTPDGRPVSYDEALVAYNALCDLGVLERNGSRYILNRQRFAATEELRVGVQTAFDFLREHPAERTTGVQLCVSLPPNLPPAAEHVIHESATDLRSSLLDVIASAKESLIVASPFWDAGTTAEMVSLARKKLASGIRVSLLGRFSRELPADVKSQLAKISNDPNCAILSWFEGTGTETQTFHFKAISADRGHRGYMGSANMTVSSLRSRMELGVILNGAAASQLDRILRVVLTMASPFRV